MKLPRRAFLHLAVGAACGEPRGGHEPQERGPS
jgi:hypothetical protein